MQNVSKEKLIQILKNSMDFVLELDIICESSKKPVYKFNRAFIENGEDSKTPEFCLIYSESEDNDEIYISVNSVSDCFVIKCAEKIYDLLIKRKSLNLILHENKNIINLLTESYKNIEFGDIDLCESFYFDGKNKYKKSNKDLRFRFLSVSDENLCGCFENDENYLAEIFEYTVKETVYYDCGIIGCFDGFNNFCGYVSYYGIGENIRDISYIYVDEKYRKKGCGKELLKFLSNKNAEENKITYYSYAENEISRSLVESCGFLSCAKRYETVIRLKSENPK